MKTSDPRTRVRQWLQKQRPHKSQGSLARDLGISKNYMSMILSGRRRPSGRIAVLIEDRTGIPARDFFTQQAGA